MDLRRWLGLLALLALPACAGAPPAQPASGETATLLVGGKIWGHPGADAVLLRGERIAAVGPAAALEEQAGPGAARVDLKGGLLLPGFHDAHAHLASAGLALEQLDLDGVKTVEDVEQALRAWAAAHPDTAWIYGRGWSYDLVPAGSFPSRRMLDAAVPDRPVVLESYDGHALWVNSAALAAAGVGPDTDDPPGGTIVREDGGRAPAGALLEDAMALVEDAVPAPEHAQALASLRAALAQLSRWGITAVNGYGSPDELALLGELEAAGELPLRVSFWLPLETDLHLAAELRDRYASPWLRVTHLKGFVDGVIESKTAFMLDPYAGSESDRGRPQLPAAELLSRVRAAHEAGFAVALHAIGDAAVRLSLDAFQAAALTGPLPPGPRHRIEHIEVVDRADLPRFAQLGVVASMQPYHANPGGPEPDAGVWSRNLGPERLARSFAWADLRGAGATLAFGSDWPVMSADPLRGLAVAVTRQDERGQPEGGWNRAQALDATRAIAAYTEGSAAVVGREAELGRLEPGFLADLVLLDPTVDPDRAATLWSGEVLQVWVGGRARLP